MPRRHEEHYFDDGTVVLLVGDTLFCVHRYYFTRESQIFADMFSLPGGGADGSSETTEGVSDSLPVRIPGVKVQEMESFLRFVYFGVHDAHTFKLECWVSLLSFSTRFVCDKIRARSIRQLEAIKTRMNPTYRIALAVRHDVPQWLSGAYQELCQRSDPLQEVEGKILGLPTVIKLMRAREILLSELSARNPYRMIRALRTPSNSFYSGGNQPDTRQPLPRFDSVEPRFDPQRVAEVVEEVFL